GVSRQPDADRRDGAEVVRSDERREERAMGLRTICIVTETYPPEINGVALTLARLADGLRARGHAVSVVCPRQPRAHAAATGGGGLRVPGVSLPSYREVRIGLPAGRALGRAWASRRPDAVYVATEGPLGWSAVRAARRWRVPVWSGYHTRFPDYARHYGAGWLEAVAWRYLRWLHNQTRGTLVAGAALRDELVGAGFARVS